MYNFGEIWYSNPRVYAANNSHFLQWYGKNRHIMLNISECPGPILTYFTWLIGAYWWGWLSRDWRSPKGRCYGSPLNFGDVRRYRQERPLLFASAFNNRFANRKSAFKRLNGNNLATSCTNLANFRPIISEFTLLGLKRAIFPWFSPIWWRSSFIAWAFRNGLEDRNFDFSVVIGNYFCTSCRNLVRFGSVTPERRQKKLYSRRRKFFWGDFR